MCNIHTSYEEMVVSKMKFAGGLKEKRREKERERIFVQREVEVNRKMMWGRIKLKEEEEVCEKVWLKWDD